MLIILLLKTLFSRDLEITTWAKDSHGLYDYEND